MTTKSRWSLSRIIKDVFILGPSLLRFARNLRAVLAYDAKLACKSMVVISVLFVLLGVFVFSAWISILALLFYSLSLYYSIWVSLSLIILLNVVLIVWVVIKMLQIKDDMFFPNTRDQLGL